MKKILITMLILSVVILSGCKSEVSYRAEAITKGDPAICYKINDPTIRDDCFWEVAKITKNRDLCHLITILDAKENCLKDAALDQSDTELCATLTDQRIKASCYVGIATKENDIRICDVIDFSVSPLPGAFDPLSNPREFCYSEIAMISIDPKVCEKIIDQKMNDFCYLKVIGQIGQGRIDPTTCEKVADQKTKDHCNRIIAERSRIR